MGDSIDATTLLFFAILSPFLEPNDKVNEKRQHVNRREFIGGMAAAGAADLDGVTIIPDGSAVL